MGFGLLMRDNSPVDAPFRRSGTAAEESVSLGYVPGGPYYPRSMPVQRALGYVPGGPYYPRSMPAQRALGFVPGGPYYPASMRRASMGGFAGRRFGIPPGQAARVPQYNGAEDHELPGLPEQFGEDTPTTGWSDTPVGPVYDPSRLDTTSNRGNSIDWEAAAKAAAALGTSIVNAFTSGGQLQCPAGYVSIGNGQCQRYAQTSSMGGMSTALLLGGLGLAAVLLTRK